MKKSLDNPIIKRTMIAFEFKKIGDIAQYFGKSRQNINGMIGRDTFINLIEPECYKRKINVEWIKTGQGEMNKAEADPAAPWERKALHESMQQQLKILADTVSKYEKTNQEMWGVINAIRNKTDNIDAAQIALGQEIGDVKLRMLDAAKHDDVKLLGIVGGKGK